MRLLFLGTAALVALACASAGEAGRNDPTRLVVMSLGTEFRRDGVAPEEHMRLVGRTLHDLAGTKGSLDSLGTLGPDGGKPIRRKGQPIAMFNDGDPEDVVDAAGDLVQSVNCRNVAEVEEVMAVA